MSSLGETRFDDLTRMPLGVSMNFPSFAARALAYVAYNPTALLLHLRLGETTAGAMLRTIVDASEYSGAPPRASSRARSSPAGCALRFRPVRMLAGARAGSLTTLHVVSSCARPVVHGCRTLSDPALPRLTRMLVRRGCPRIPPTMPAEGERVSYLALMGRAQQQGHLLCGYYQLPQTFDQRIRTNMDTVGWCLGCRVWVWARLGVIKAGLLQAGHSC
jgi:hypothetical protein